MSKRNFLNEDTFMSSLPAISQESLMPLIQRELQKRGEKLIILDDDPTGTQTVHDVAVITEHSVESLIRELNDAHSTFFILTNSRSMPAAEAITLNKTIARNIQAAAEKTGRKFRIISRGDSTLRGHFPSETDALSETFSSRFDATLFIPAFMAGRRYTYQSIHYVGEGESLIPVAETAFAQDKAFGFMSSNLEDWLIEKSGGKVSKIEIHSIHLEDIRLGSVEKLQVRLESLENGAYCVVDAVHERDIEILVTALLHAEAQGKNFLYRSAASFAAIRAGIQQRDVLSASELSSDKKTGGLVIAGSYVLKTSAQIKHVLANTAIEPIEIDVNNLLNHDRCRHEIRSVLAVLDEFIGKGKDVLLYTSRKLIAGNNAESSLAIGNQISACLVEIVSKLKNSPRYIIAKGGITSSDIATQALNVKRAWVKGQLLKGVPVWQLGNESRYPNMVYVIFPGNVGGDDTLSRAIEKLAV